jgi:hypothetical protein
MPRAETLAIVLTPVAAMATFALGLRVGAENVMRAAIVYGAPPSAGREGLAWQLMTVREESGVREAVPTSGISVVARAGDRVASWQGDTNADGIAELWLDLPVKSGDAVTIDVRDRTQILARGTVRWEQVPWGPDERTSPWVPASKRGGNLAVEVAIDGQKLAAGFPASVWVLVMDRVSATPVAGARVDAEPEPGLELAQASATTCANGWAELVATAKMHVVGVSLQATDPAASEATIRPGQRTRSGEWFGALPVAPGGSFVALPEDATPGTAIPLVIQVPTMGRLVYLEVDDSHGRAFAAVPAVLTSAGGWPTATVVVPPLAAGAYWVVTSGDPRGAESLEVATLARPMVVGGGARVRCETGPELAQMAAAPFQKWIALDGTRGAMARTGAKRARGLVLAWGGLAIAAALEALLLVRAAGRARRDVARLRAALSEEGDRVPELAPPFSLTNLVIGILLALLGFALVGSLLTWRAG